MIFLHGNRTFSGQSLAIKRIPLFLRVVTTLEGDALEFDALDRLEDKPKFGEVVHVFVRVTRQLGSVRTKGGRYPIAHYWIWREGPNTDLRSAGGWRRFVNEQMELPLEADELPDGYTFPAPLEEWIKEHNTKLEQTLIEKREHPPKYDPRTGKKPKPRGLF